MVIDQIRVQALITGVNTSGEEQPVTYLSEVVTIPVTQHMPKSVTIGLEEIGSALLNARAQTDGELIADEERRETYENLLSWGGTA